MDKIHLTHLKRLINVTGAFLSWLFAADPPRPVDLRLLSLKLLVVGTVLIAHKCKSNLQPVKNMYFPSRIHTTGMIVCCVSWCALFARCLCLQDGFMQSSAGTRRSFCEDPFPQGLWAAPAALALVAGSRMTAVTSSSGGAEVIRARRTEPRDVSDIVSLFSSFTDELFGRVDVTYLL